MAKSRDMISGPATISFLDEIGTHAYFLSYLLCNTASQSKSADPRSGFPLPFPNIVPNELKVKSSAFFINTDPNLIVRLMPICQTIA